MAMQDITIMGAGIFGLSIAWECLRRGARVQVIDPGGPGAGASGGLVGALAPHVPERWNDKKAFQFESLLMAEPFWQEVEAISGRPSGYLRSGRIQPLANPHAVELARARAQEAETLWQGRARWQVVDANPAPGWAPDSPTGHWVLDTLSARMAPRMAAASLAAAIAARGGDITRQGQPRGQVIWATGAAGLADLSAALGHVVGAPIKGQSAVFACDRRALPQIFAQSLHLVPHADGTVAVGSTTERNFDAPNTTDDQLEELIARARALSPAVGQAPVIGRWAGLRPRARSRAPMLGPWPGRPGHFIANGGFKIGFGVAPKVAQVMADLVLDGHDTIPEGFRVEASLPAAARP